MRALQRGIQGVLPFQIRATPGGETPALSHPHARLNTQTLAATRGKRICLLRFVESWKKLNDAIGIVVLERFVESSGSYLNRYVFASLDLRYAMLHVYSEHDGSLTEILKINFPYCA